jgi:limonene-1,2-epoxide hydrolase
MTDAATPATPATPADDERLVLDFLAALGSDLDGIRAAIRGYTTDDFVYENPGVPTCHGQLAAIELYEQFHRIAGFTRVDITVRHVRSGQGIVMVERWDAPKTADGAVIGGEPGPCLGAFELRNGWIAAWRDYYDPTPLLSYFGSLA